MCKRRRCGWRIAYLLALLGGIADVELHAQAAPGQTRENTAAVRANWLAYLAAGRESTGDAKPTGR